MHFKNGEVYPEENNGNNTYTLTWSLIIRKSKPKITIFSKEVRKSELWLYNYQQMSV